MNKLLLSCVFLCGSLQATAVTNVNISWNITEIASGTSVCSGQLFTNFTGTVCGGVIPEFAGFDFDVLATAAEAPGFVFAEVLVKGIVADGLEGDVPDPLLYNWEVSAFGQASVSTSFMIVGGTGDGLFEAFGSSGGGQDGPGTAFGAVSDIAGIPCGQAVNPCVEQSPIAFVFGEPIYQNAFTSAGFIMTNLNGDNIKSEASGQGISGTTVDSIFDANGNPISGVQFVAVGGPSEVSEPSCWLLCCGGVVLISLYRLYYGSRKVIS
jgi:hypothetical protein